MITQDDIQQVFDAAVYSSDGEKIGSVGQVYLDDRTGAPEWVSVKTGLFGTKETFVPLDKANLNGDRVEVPFGKDQVKDAPQIDADGDLSPAEEDQLYTYYGLTSTDGRLDTGSSYDEDTTTAATGIHDPGYTAQDSSPERSDDGSMTRSEERLVTGTRTEEAGKARLRKYVVTEQQQVKVPVSREEVTLEREPITDANAGDAFDGPQISEAEHEVTLHAERPVVDTEVVPVERIRLNKETVNEQESVQGEVRKEQIEFDGPDSRDRS